MGKSKIFGSLIRRVTTIFCLLVILPLGVYAGFLWHRDQNLKKRLARAEMTLIGSFAEAYLVQWYDETLIQLDLFAEDQATKQKIALRDLSTFVILDMQGRVTFSSQESLIGKKGVFSKVLAEARDGVSLMTIDQDPINGKNELLVFTKKGAEIWVAGIDLQEWASVFLKLNQIGYPTQLLFVMGDRKIPLEKQAGEALTYMREVPQALFQLEVSISKEALHTYEGGEFYAHLFTLFIILICLGIFGTIWLVRRMAKPLTKLSEIMDQVAKGQEHLQYQSDSFGFEINIIGENLNWMVRKLLENQKLIVNERVAREIISKELEIGRSVQRELLPKEIPHFPNLAVGICFEPAKEVGGDFYDLFSYGNEDLLIAVADASDKGVSACFYSLSLRSILRSFALEETDLVKIMGKANLLFCEDTGLSGNFVTAWVGIYEKRSATLHYCSAGHLPGLLIFPDGRHKELTSKGIALGVEKNATYEIQTVELKEGELLCLYSDGVTEAENKGGEFFGKSRLLDVLKQSHYLEAQACADTVYNQVLEYVVDQSQHDDITILCFKQY